MIETDSLIVLITLASAEVVGVVLILVHLMKNFLTRKKLLITIATINTIAALAIGLQGEFSWHKLFIVTILFSLLLTGVSIFIVFMVGWMNPSKKPSSRDNELKQ